MSELYETKLIKPRKVHLCRVCNERIELEEACYSYRGVEQGEGFYTLYFHHDCSEHSKAWDWWDWDRHMPGNVSRKEIQLIEAREKEHEDTKNI